MNKHIILAGDSIFDNDGYVLGEAGVIEQLRSSLPKQHSASKIAVDGDCIKHIKDQLQNLPSNATDIFISVGGNDARYYSDLLGSISNEKDLYHILLEPLKQFEASYEDMIEHALSTKLRIVVSTIYTNVPFESPIWRKFAPIAIQEFNSVIKRQAKQKNIPVLYLEKICTEACDYSTVSPIEPSSKGGQKIVNAIIEMI